MILVKWELALTQSQAGKLDNTINFWRITLPLNQTIKIKYPEFPSYFSTFGIKTWRNIQCVTWEIFQFNFVTYRGSDLILYNLFNRKSWLNFPPSSFLLQDCSGGLSRKEVSYSIWASHCLHTLDKLVGRYSADKIESFHLRTGLFSSFIPRWI